MSANGHSGYYHPADSIGYLPAAFEFYCIGAALLDHPDRATDSLVVIDLIRTERHIHHYQRMLCGADNPLGEEDHLVHRDGQGVLIAANDVRGAVADEEHLNA